jgi:hypothetical protein
VLALEVRSSGIDPWERTFAEANGAHVLAFVPVAASTCDAAVGTRRAAGRQRRVHDRRPAQAGELHEFVPARRGAAPLGYTGQLADRDRIGLRR